MKPSNLLLLVFVAACLTSALPAEEPVPLAERTFRVIRETQSPDKRFALGLGLTTDRVKAGQPRLIPDDPSAEAALLDRESHLRNYLVDLRDQVILTETGAMHFSAGPTYNQNDCTAHWSPDSRMVVQVCTFKSRYCEAFQLLRIDPDGRRASEPYDLEAPAKERAIAFLKKRHNRAWTKLSKDEEFAIRPLFLTLTNDTVALTVWGEIVHSPKRDSKWAVRVKMRVATTAKFVVGVETLSVRYAHEGDEVETRLSQHSPDKRYAMQIVYEAGHDPWSSLFIHRIELVALPERKVLTQLLPASEVGTQFGPAGSEMLITPRLTWSSDSRWCAFYLDYWDRGNASSGYTIVFREADGKFVAANEPKLLRTSAQSRKIESRFDEDVAPVRWARPGVLILKQSCVRRDDLANISWELEAAYDAKKDTMRVVRANELNAEEAGKLDTEIHATLETKQ